MTDRSCFTLDEEGFRLCCRRLLQRSEQLRDGWSWDVVPGSHEGYLRKTVLRSVRVESRLNAAGGEQRVDDSSAALQSIGGHWEDEDDDEGTCSVAESSSQTLQYEYHVLYSCSYNTPVLYFRAFTLGGRSLSLEEVWRSVHAHFRLRLLESPLETISQQEHPLLGQPFFMLHPCRTEELMKPLLQAALHQNRPVNYVLSWLSAVAPAVGLHVPLQYGVERSAADQPD